MKKNYIQPTAKIRKVNNESLLGSTSSTITISLPDAPTAGDGEELSGAKQRTDCFPIDIWSDDNE
ncbi:MAG: hypothetical protein ACI4T9_09570 [Prevotella sp.]